MRGKNYRAAAVVLGLCLGLAWGDGGHGITAWASDEPVEIVYLGEPEHVWWETDTAGKWSPVEDAGEYQVKLYISDDVERDEEDWRGSGLDGEDLEAVMTARTQETGFDFSAYMEDGHGYFFAVRATPKVNEQAYVRAGEWAASRDVDMTKEIMGLTGGTWRNYLDGSRYEDKNGEFLGGGWHRIGGSWYLFDERGFRLTGWQTVDGKKYYLDGEGKMAEGWFPLGDDWYYAGPSGELQTGWVMDKPGCYYYLDEEGRMLHDTWVDGWWVDSTGYGHPA